MGRGPFVGLMGRRNAEYRKVTQRHGKGREGHGYWNQARISDLRVVPYPTESVVAPLFSGFRRTEPRLGG